MSLTAPQKWVPAPAPLGNTQKSAPTPDFTGDSAPSQKTPQQLAQAARDRQTAGFDMLWQLRTFTSNRRVKQCRTRIAPKRGDDGQVRRELRAGIVLRAPEGQCQCNGAGRATLQGVEVCGSVWICPMCSSKILAKRTEELLQLCREHTAAGGRLGFVTLTMRHYYGQGLRLQFKAKAAAWACARGRQGDNRSVRRAMLDELTGWAFRTDVTTGRNGWHTHGHALLFLPAGYSRDGLEYMAAHMFDGWRDKLLDLGLDADPAHGLDVKLVQSTKGMEERLAKYVCRDAALEVASGQGKRGRRGNRSIWQLQADCAEHIRNGDTSHLDLALWREYETTTKGQHSLRYSNGLKDILAPDMPDISDQEAAEEDDGEGRLIAELTPDLLRALIWTRPKQGPPLVAQLLQHIGEGEYEDAFQRTVNWWREHNLPGLPRHPVLDAI